MTFGSVTRAAVLAVVIAAGDASSGPAAAADRPTADSPSAEAAVRGTTITVRPSRFGRMLFDSRGQAIYGFERDRRNRSTCYGACARAWPPVYTEGRPRAAGATRSSLLGTTRRRDGRLQVTYAGKPLYFYVNEEPGEVRCHNVNLNGGLWWVIGPDGKRRP
jgi:predicted lipoprotein with Yx(FWY)xxD motif